MRMHVVQAPAAAGVGPWQGEFQHACTFRAVGVHVGEVRQSPWW
jgi:hypothetical protein